MEFTYPNLIEGDGSLDSGLVAHSLKTLLPLLNLVHLVHNTVHLNFARVKIVNSGRELVGLRETAEDSDFITDCKDNQQGTQV